MRRACHSNLDLDVAAHAVLLGGHDAFSLLLFLREGELDRRLARGVALRRIG